MPNPWLTSTWLQAIGITVPRSFAAVTFALLCFLALPRWRRETLLALSLTFFGLFLGWPLLAAHLVFVLLWFSVLHWADASPDHPERRQWVTTGTLLFTILAYLGLMNSYRLGPAYTLPTVQALGISYLFWRVIHVTVDWRQDKLRLNRLPLFLLYHFYFPTMKSGPMQRYQDFFTTPFFLQEAWRPQLSLPIFFRIGGGLAKLLVCYFWLTLDYARLWEQTATLPYLMLVKILYVRAFSFYLFASGANDLTLMLSRILQIPLPENYHYPYFQRNLAHFWRNWHMTLTACLRDYVYEPLGGKRKHQYFNYIVTFLVCAFWHVCSPAFLIWGLMHGVGLCILRVWQDFWSRRVPAMGKGGEGLRRIRAFFQAHSQLSGTLSGLLTFHFVALSWLPFWGGHPQGTRAIFRLLGLPDFW